MLQRDSAQARVSLRDRDGACSASTPFWTSSQTSPFSGSDNLKNLSLLLGIVVQKTETLVVLCGRNFLHETWCICEMSTLVLFPNLEHSSPVFIESYGTAERTQSLAPYSIIVQMALLAVSFVPGRAPFELFEFKEKRNIFKFSLPVLFSSWMLWQVHSGAAEFCQNYTRRLGSRTIPCVRNDNNRRQVLENSYSRRLHHGS